MFLDLFFVFQMGVEVEDNDLIHIFSFLSLDPFGRNRKILNHSRLFLKQMNFCLMKEELL